MADNTIANAIKFLKGEEKSLPTTKTEGQVYFAYKNVGTAEKPSYTGAIYIDTPIGGTQNRIKMTANADVADKAFNDASGLSIRDTYLSGLGYTDDGKQTILIKGSGNNQTRVALPIASPTKSGIVTTDAQSFGGTKTFITINSSRLTVTESDGFNYSGIGPGTVDAVRPIWFADNSANGKPVVNTNFTYNPATQTLKVANLSGTADRATNDGSGDNIRSTYIKSITVNGTTLTITKGGGATSSITLQDTNNKVTQTAIKSSDYTNWRTVLWGASNSATEGFAPTTVTDGAFTSDTLIFQPSSGTLKAKIFKGNLSGNATTATNADKATNDSSGQSIRSTYISSVEVDKDNKYKYNFKTPTGAIRNSITIYDEFQKRSNVDATTDWNTLTSTGIYKVQMSAWGDATKMHSPNSYNKDLYSFGILLVFESIANDSEKRFTQIYIPHFESVSISSSAYKRMHNGSDITTGWQIWHPIARGLHWNEIFGKPNYAGSSSAGGAATSANKLNTNAGSTTLPVYFSGGIPVVCSTNLGVSITGNAASATKLTSNAGSTTQPIYFKDGKPVATTYSLNATVKAGVSNRLAFYSGTNEISSAGNLKYYTATNSKGSSQTILRVWGSTYGNDATTMISGKAGSLSWNDGGPQIQFSTSEAGSQDGALIFTDHDSSGIGASFHFVSNQGDWSVNSKRFVARTSIIIGQEAHTSSNQGYNLYINGTGYINGILTAVGDCAFIAHGNEFNFVPTLKASTSVWFNYRQTGGQPTDGNFTISEYIFGNGANKALASIKDGLFSGAATYVRDSNNNTNNISITYSKAGQASTSWLASWNGYELGAISPNNIIAGKATILATARTITLSGAVTGSVSFNGSANVTLTTSVNHTHSQYYDSGISRTANTVLAAPNGSAGGATFRKLVAADIPTLTKSKISDFPTSMPASDVYAWAKASTKPSYSWGEITGKPSTFTPSSHTHNYLPLSGGTMTGTINFTTNKLACMFGGSTSAYYSGVMHQNFGNEAVVFAATNSVTSFIFKCGQNPTSMANNTWANITPSMQIKSQSVYINSLIGNGVTPAYNLYVNGSTRCNGILGVGNGSSAEIDFFPSSSSTIGARIKAYNDRIEFVFS